MAFDLPYRGVGQEGAAELQSQVQNFGSHFLKVSQVQVRQTLELSWLRKDRRDKALVNLLTQL